MTRPTTPRLIAAALLAASAALGVAGSAQARPELQVSIGLPGLPGLPLPLPPGVVIRTEPPRPVFVPPPVVIDRPGRPEAERDGRHAEWERREMERREMERREWERRDWERREWERREMERREMERREWERRERERRFEHHHEHPRGWGWGRS